MQFVLNGSTRSPARLRVTSAASWAGRRGSFVTDLQASASAAVCHAIRSGDAGSVPAAGGAQHRGGKFGMVETQDGAREVAEERVGRCPHDVVEDGQ